MPTTEQSDKIRIILADDHALVRDGIKSLLEDEEDLIVIDEANDGQEALEKSAEKQPDLLIIDIRMPGMTGIEAAGKLSHYSQHTKALVLSMHDSDEYVLQSIEAGAKGYLLKDTSRDEFLKAIHTVHSGGQYFSGDISTILVRKYMENRSGGSASAAESGPASTLPGNAPLDLSLTRRERQIFDLVLLGKSNKEIADELKKSVRTIEAHRYKLMKKLDVKNLAELTQKARSLGLI
ncbi:response regulator transcription factor [Flavilitoribacter nigricans]|uniref:DNA-binding response regulator n=1 Tax=Flavilitoribacter nigricans (strain ATCC 23147 / DSM 23189 / NBRC 102662 / NCIMB 1420 / SS-2) TaxID=1122177 RepID=A0A2D0N5I5_FLAN2|nr:response regulator transcription factor [Flavilitoribacter nigricans]PHN03764.1 DNA-binding response regulator [Flavilitoribacter nigricans DSM 23189 = NBRC 102662]